MQIRKDGELNSSGKAATKFSKFIDKTYLFENKDTNFHLGDNADIHYQLNVFYKSIVQSIPQEYDLDDHLILERYQNSVIDTPEVELLTEVLLPIKKL